LLAQKKPHCFIMAAVARSNATAFEHILAVPFEQPHIASLDAELPKFRACCNEAGVTCASDFFLIAPSACGGMHFSPVKDDADKDAALDFVQIKKLSSLVSWF
jgi:hypothetical protein